MTPEQKAREAIDQRLIQAGWILQDMRQLNPMAGPGVAVREFPTSTGPVDYAPADGIISFAGSVGGKSVVSVNHGDLVSTFEPAHTEGVAGTAVRRGDVIGEVGGASDHCDGRCLHWGVRRVRLQNEGTATTYLDPLARVRPMRIGLKPD